MSTVRLRMGETRSREAGPLRELPHSVLEHCSGFKTEGPATGRAPQAGGVIRCRSTARVSVRGTGGVS
jgi:hypothetical protein